jgi:hypothetical protein
MAPNSTISLGSTVDNSNYGDFRGGDIYASNVYSQTAVPNTAADYLAQHAFVYYDSSFESFTVAGHVGCALAKEEDTELTNTGAVMEISNAAQTSYMILNPTSTVVGNNSLDLTLVNTGSLTTVDRILDITPAELYMNGVQTLVTETTNTTLNTVEGTAFLNASDDGAGTVTATITADTTTITGDLIVSGTTTTIDSEVVTVEDKSIRMGSSETDASAPSTLNYAGIKIGDDGVADANDNGDNGGLFEFLLNMPTTDSDIATVITNKTATWTSNIGILVDQGGNTVTVDESAVLMSDGASATNTMAIASNTITDGTNTTTTDLTNFKLDDGTNSNVMAIASNTITDGTNTTTTDLTNVKLDDGADASNIMNISSNTITDGTNVTTTDLTNFKLFDGTSASNTMNVSSNTITDGTNSTTTNLTNVKLDDGASASNTMTLSSNVITDGTTTSTVDLTTLSIAGATDSNALTTTTATITDSTNSLTNTGTAAGITIADGADATYTSQMDAVLGSTDLTITASDGTDTLTGYYSYSAMKVSSASDVYTEITDTQVLIKNGDEEFLLTSSGVESESLTVKDSNATDSGAYWTVTFDSDDATLNFNYFTSSSDTGTTKFSIST